MICVPRDYALTDGVLYNATPQIRDIVLLATTHYCVLDITASSGMSICTSHYTTVYCTACVTGIVYLELWPGGVYAATALYRKSNSTVLHSSSSEGYCIRQVMRQYHICRPHTC